MPALPPSVVPSRQAPKLVLTSMNLSRLYSPGRGISSSLLIHAGVLLVLQVLAMLDNSAEKLPPDPGALSPGNGVRMVMYLPSMGGGDEGQGGGLEFAEEEPAATPSTGPEGLVYPGPQVMRSESPLPDGGLQTLLQPELEDLPLLEESVDLPNFISMPEVPDVAPEPAEEVAVEPARPALEDLPILEPRLDVPEPVKVVEQQFVEPPRVATEVLQRSLEVLPILKPRLDAPVLLSTPAIDFVLPTVPVEQAVALPDTVKPEEPEPVELAEGEVTELVQKELEELPLLKRRLDAPDLLAASKPPDIVEPEEELPVDVQEVETEPVQRPLEDLPILKPRLDSPNLLAASKLPDPVEFEERPNLPVVKLRLDVPRTDLPMILALTPNPTSAELPEEIPAAEARGGFAISPEPNLDTSETEPGSLSGVETEDVMAGLTVETISTAVVNLSFGGGEGLKIGGSSSSGDGDNGSESGPGSGPGPGIGSGSGSGAGSGPGMGPFGGITILGGVGGTATAGSGIGSGSGIRSLGGITILGGIGTGSFGPGTGADSDQASLAGITVVGGVDGTQTPPNSVTITRVPNPLPQRYGVLSVVSTESSGGGLPYFGVFSDEQIRTVYLDLRQEENEEAPLWTLEFGVPGNSSVQKDSTPEPDEEQESEEGRQEDGSQPADESQPGEPGRQGDENRQEGESEERQESQEDDKPQPEFVLPVPIVKERPTLPFELDQRHVGKMIIVYAVINVEGKMEQMLVMESPDPLLNQAVLDALREWVFLPGQLNGAPIAVKALLGMPLWSPAPPASSLILTGSIPSGSP